VRVFFTNLGCKLNQAEIDRFARDFVAAGHRVVGSLAEADLHVVNTCTVTHAAARTSRRSAGRARRSGAPARTVLTGCWATEQGPEAARLAGVDLVVPNPEKERLVERVHQAFPEVVPGAIPGVVPEGGPGLDVPFVPLPFGNTRGLLKVEDGCDMRCSFCIIPHTRGRQRSRPLPELAEEVRALAGRYREIVVTGVQISAWRGERGQRLADLVRGLLSVLQGREATPSTRLRLTSIAPWDLDERLLDLWADPRLCRHLHLSLQSGCTETLRRMRRPYTAESYLRLLERVRAAVPEVAVTTDVIAGFPGETDAESEESLATVEAARFAKVHAFPFSPRPGTEAAGLPGQVSPEAKKERMERLLAASGRAEEEFRRAHLGRRATVLWEKPKEGVGQGLTDNYLRVFCPEGAGLRNRLSTVRLTGLAEGGLSGEILGEGHPCAARG
jgi:threonylcarbamoyladenosine tRNA methylthiotransferase MtaB